MPLSSQPLTLLAHSSGTDAVIAVRRSDGRLIACHDGGEEFSLDPPALATYKEAARVATAAALPSFTQSSVNTLTATANGALTVDSVAVAVGNRVLVTNDGAYNGIYTVERVGDGSTPWSLVRAGDANSVAEFTTGMITPVVEGAVNGGIFFVYVTTGAITLNTTPLTFLSQDVRSLALNVSELRNSVGVASEVRYLSGYLTPNDGAQGTFQWDTASALDDGGLRFNQGGFGTSSAGWKRVFSGAIDVRWFGAKGDGIVANEAVAINRAVQAAIALQVSSPESLVTCPDLRIPAGVYLITQTINLQNYFGRIDAEGAVIHCNDKTVDVLSNIAKNITLRGLSIEGGRDAFSIATANLDSVVINLENCSTRRVHRQHIKADSNSNSSLLNIHGCRFLSEAYNVTGASHPASPIEITTAVAHEFETGDQVHIRDVVGNTAANGTWTITKTSSTKFTLNGSTSNSAYVSGGTVGLTADLFVFDSIDHINFVDCWVTSCREITWHNNNSRLRLRGGIYVSGQASLTTARWIQNDLGSVWATQNMFSGETARQICKSAAPADDTGAAAVSVIFRDNLFSSPTSVAPFEFTAIPNEICIRDNVGLLAETVLSGGGNKFSGYTALGAKSTVDMDGQFMRTFSSDSDDLTARALLAATWGDPDSPQLWSTDAIRTLEAFGAGDSDYTTDTANASTTVSTSTNAFGHTTVTVLATSAGGSWHRSYTNGLADLADGSYTLAVEVDVRAGHVSAHIEAADASNTGKRLGPGRHVVSLPFVYKSGTTAQSVAVRIRDMANAANVHVGPYRIYSGLVAIKEPRASVYGSAAPTGPVTMRWLVGDVVWNAQPSAGEPLAFLCTASSARTGVRQFDAGTWIQAGHVVNPGADGSVPVSNGTSYSWTITPRLSASGYIEFGASAAASGFIRAPNNTTGLAIKGASAALAAWVVGDSFDQAFFNGGTNAFLNAGTTSNRAGLAVASALKFEAGNTGLFSYVAGFNIDQAVSSPTWGFTQKTTADNPTDWTFKGQSAFAGSADAGGYINLEGGTKDGAGLQGGVRLKDGAGSILIEVGDTGMLAFYGVAKVARPAAYTQTYSTATRTHSNPTGVALTDSSGGTADQTVANPPDPADAPATADILRDDLVANTLPVIRNNFADLTDEINKLIADVANLKQLVNQVIDDLQANGLLQ